MTTNTIPRDFWEGPFACAIELQQPASVEQLDSDTWLIGELLGNPHHPMNRKNDMEWILHRSKSLSDTATSDTVTWQDPYDNLFYTFTQQPLPRISRPSGTP